MRRIEDSCQRGRIRRVPPKGKRSPFAVARKRRSNAMKIKRQSPCKFPARPKHSLFRKRKSLFGWSRELPISRRTCTQIDVGPDQIGAKFREFAVIFPVRREFTSPAPMHRQYDGAFWQNELPLFCRNKSKRSPTPPSPQTPATPRTPKYPAPRSRPPPRPETPSPTAHR